MGRQMTIYLLPSDTSLLEESLKATLDICFFEYESPRSRPKVAKSLTVPTMGESWLTIYLAPQSRLENIVCEKVPTKGYWTIDSLLSPVIEFSRCYFNGRILKEGRLFYDTGYYDESGKWVDKSKDFLKWAEKLFRITKKILNKSPDNQAYIGPNALIWLKKQNSQ